MGKKKEIFSSDFYLNTLKCTRIQIFFTGKIKYNDALRRLHRIYNNLTCIHFLGTYHNLILTLSRVHPRKLNDLLYDFHPVEEYKSPQCDCANRFMSTTPE